MNPETEVWRQVVLAISFSLVQRCTKASGRRLPIPWTLSSKPTFRKPGTLLSFTQATSEVEEERFGKWRPKGETSC
jgi:hypothetical protein